MQSMGKSLLELSAEKLGCYISDLAWPLLDENFKMRQKLRQVIAELDAKKFEAHEWNEAITYILGGTADFKETQDAKKYLKKQLETPKSQRF